MVVALSYIIAVLITVALAIFLYPVAALFWIFGLLGKLSDDLFEFTRKTIAALWRDLRNSEKATMMKQPQIAETVDVWMCECGCSNTGKFCSECGKTKILDVKVDDAQG